MTLKKKSGAYICIWEFLVLRINQSNTTLFCDMDNKILLYYMTYIYGSTLHSHQMAIVLAIVTF